MTNNRRRAIIWFRGTDLRLHDNPIIDEAHKLVAAGAIHEVLPVYVYDPRFFAATPAGDPRTGPRRAQFLLESVADLRSSLLQAGNDLLVLVGHPEHLLPQLVHGDKPLVLTTAEVASEELRIERRVSSALRDVRGSLKAVWGSTLYHVDDLPFGADLRDLPDVFTPFRNKVESRCTVRAPLPSPKSLPPAEALAEGLPRFDGGLEELSAALPPSCPPLTSTRAAGPTVCWIHGC